MASSDPLNKETRQQNRDRLARNLADDIRVATEDVLYGRLRSASATVRRILFSEQRYKHDSDRIAREYKRIAAGATSQLKDFKSMKIRTVSVADHAAAFLGAAARLKKDNVVSKPFEERKFSDVISRVAHAAVLLWVRFEPLFCHDDPDQNQPISARIKETCMLAIEEGVKKDISIINKNYTFDGKQAYTFDMHVIATTFACAYGIRTSERTFIRPFPELSSIIPDANVLSYLPGCNRTLFTKVDECFHNHTQALTRYPALDLTCALPSFLEL